MSNCAGNLDHLIPIHYNDQTVRLNPDRPMNIKWVNSAGGDGSMNSLEKSKTKQTFPDLPKAQFKRICNELAKEKAFKIPNSYVQYTDREEESRRDEVEYDLDREDLEWLKLVNDRRDQARQALIAESDLERAIDLLEKESHFQFTQTGQSSSHAGLPFLDNDAPCCICNDSEDSNANQIIFCDMCNIAVHQECYGVPYIPEGQWLCRRCQFSPSVSVHCALCPFTTGAFKQTADGRWVHVICTIWLNEVHFANTVFLEPVEGVDFSLKRRHKLTCTICRNKVGACLQCSHRTCSRAFHVTCAFYAGMKMEVKESRPKKNNNPEAVTINRFVYCHQHSQLLYGPKSDESKAARQREIKEKMREARRRLNADAKQTNSCVPVPMIPREKIVEIAHQLQLDHFGDIAAFWSQKRQSRCGVPLIRRLQVYLGQQKPFAGRHSLDGTAVIPFDQHQEQQQPCTSRAASVQSQGQQQQRHPISDGGQGQDPVVRLANLRRDFERIRLLCELVKKREKLKWEAVNAGEQLLAKMKPVLVILRETLDRLVEKDHQKVFTQPVNEADVPGYSAIIAQPMDLQEMRRRLDKGRYQRAADVRADFTLMMNNCATFNRDNLYFFNYGHRIKRIGLSVLKGAEAEEANLGQYLQLMGQAIDQMGIPDAPPAHKLQMELNKMNDGGTTAFALAGPPPVPSSSASSSDAVAAADGLANVKNEAEDEEKQQKPSKKQQSTTRRKSVSSNKKSSSAATIGSAATAAASTPTTSISASNKVTTQQRKRKPEEIANLATTSAAQKAGRASIISSSSTMDTTAKDGNGKDEKRKKKNKDIIGKKEEQLSRRASGQQQQQQIVATTSSKHPLELPVATRCATADVPDEPKADQLVTPTTHPRRVVTSSARKRKAAATLLSADEPEAQQQSSTAAPGTLKRKIITPATSRPKSNQLKREASNNKSAKGSTAASNGKEATPLGKPKKQQKSKTITMPSSQLNSSITELHPVLRKSVSSSTAAAAGRGVAKQTYANAYLTEASSAADDDDSDSAIGIAAGTSPPSIVEEEMDDDDELPPIVGQQQQHVVTIVDRRSNGHPQQQRRKGGGNARIQCAREIFHHNDIVWVPQEGGIRMPGRVIDLRMHFDDGISAVFMEQALSKKPYKSAEPYTLVMLFNRNNTWQWHPDSRLELCPMSDAELEHQFTFGHNHSAVSEALVRARQFRQNVVSDS